MGLAIVNNHKQITAASKGIFSPFQNLPTVTESDRETILHQTMITQPQFQPGGAALPLKFQQGRG